MSRKYLSAKETEQIMQESRDEIGFNGEFEKTVIKTAIETAKQNGRIGDKILLVINPMYIHIPSWQRRLTVSRAIQIGTNYNHAKWDVPKVLYNSKEQKLEGMDGQHRIYGAFYAHMDGIVVEVLEMEEKEAIEIFLDQSKDRSAMNPYDTYNASIKAGKEEYVLLRKICHDNNVEIKGDDETLENPIGMLTSISDGIGLARNNPDLLDRILRLIGNLQWNGSGDMNVQKRAYTAKYLRVLKKLYAYYGNEIEDVLIRRCKGTEYFNKKLFFFSQDQLFDFLSNIIGTELNIKVITSIDNKKSKAKKKA